MKAFIFDPLWNKLIYEDLENQLRSAGIETIITKDIAPLRDCKELFAGDEDRMLCLNPDYVEWKLSADDYKDIPNLKAILGAATSFAWVDTSYANEHNISVCNIRHFSTEAVAEWAITMLLNVARQTARLIKDEFPLDFDNDFLKYRGVELHDKKVGVIGFGHIGAAIAKRCAGLGMDVTYWSKSPKQTEYQAVELAALMADSDVIFPTMALNNETKTLLTDDLMRSMKNMAILISIEHKLFNIDVVLEMVKTNKLFGFGFEANPKAFGDYEGNVWAAPPYGWATDGSMTNLMIKWCENMVNASQGKFPNRVNV